MKKSRWLFIFMLLLSHNLLAQKDKYLLSSFDGKPFNSLYVFLKSQCELDNIKKDDVLLSHREIFSDSLNLKFGIYKFGKPKSHAKMFLYFLDDKQNKKFITNYSTENVIYELSVFFKKNKQNLSENLKLAYLNSIANFLQERKLAKENEGFFVPN